MCPSETRGDAKSNFRLTELGSFGAKPYVAAQCKLQPAAQGVAMDSSYNRYIQIIYALEGAVPRVGKGLGLRPAQANHFPYVRARAEGLAFAADYQHPHFRVPFNLCRRHLYFIQHGGIERVQRLGAVQFKQRDVSALFKPYKFHFYLPIPRLTISVTAKLATSSAYLPAPKPAS